MDTGSTSYVLMNSLFYVGFYCWSREKLSKTKRCLEENIRLIKQRKHLMLLVLLIPLGRTISTLYAAETLPNFVNVPDGVSTKLEDELRMDNPNQSKAFYFNEMLIAYTFRMFDETKVFAVKYSKISISESR